MTSSEPVTELDPRYSQPDATPTPWATARAALAAAEVYWLSTVRPGGQPHVTPVLALWLDEALWFSTGPDEQKARNLAQNPHCALTTGQSSLARGVDLVVEGRADNVRDEDALRRVADAYERKYGEDWRYDVFDGALHHAGRPETVAVAFAVAPVKAYAFGKGEDTFSHTRYRFRVRP
jgi:nitroimidazol reductase NimA-like FMN-containing flavoprotein (pyridoxamine 5'-phosphate oxidase superfamily)